MSNDGRGETPAITDLRRLTATEKKTPNVRGWWHPGSSRARSTPLNLVPRGSAESRALYESLGLPDQQRNEDQAVKEGTKPEPLLLELLAWIARTPRTYDGTMEVWRTTCPRPSAWEDAWMGSLVFVELRVGEAGEKIVNLTERGKRLLWEVSRQTPPNS